MKRILSLALALLMLGASVSANYVIGADKKMPLPETTVTGIGDSINARSDKKLTRTLTVTPANGGRTVKLQLYISSEKKYKTIQTYQTPDAAKAKVTITFPKKWRKKRTGKWRIVVKKSTSAEKAVRRVTVTSRNIVTKKLSAKSACIYCIEDGTVVYGKKLHTERKQASTTKLMTSILLLESGKLDKTTKISKKAANTPYNHPTMKAGDRYANQDLLYALLLPSSNGGAVAVAESVSGSTSAFVRAMNEKAKELGLRNTHFANPHGLDADNHYSSAYDLAMQMAYIYPKDATFRKVLATKKYTFTSKKLNIRHTIKSTDKLKGYSENHKGGKTGTTSGAGCCYVSVYTYGGKTYAVAFLGSAESKYRWSDAKKLYAYIDSYASASY